MISSEPTYPYYGEQPGYGGVDVSSTLLPKVTLYTNAKGGAMLYEHGNYRWLQPSEVANAKAYVTANKGLVSDVDDTQWAELVTKQKGEGSSGMATGQVPTGKYADRISGFSGDKLADLSHQTPKYIFARMASNFDTTDPEQRKQLLEMLRADPSGFFKNASWGGTNGDKLLIGGTLAPEFEGINAFDVFGGSKAGVWTPTWQPIGGPGFVAETPATAAATTTTNPVPSLNVPAMDMSARNYGQAPVFAPVNPYQGMSPEAYRLLAQPNVPTTMNALAYPTAKR